MVFPAYIVIKMLAYHTYYHTYLNFDLQGSFAAYTSELKGKKEKNNKIIPKVGIWQGTGSCEVYQAFVLVPSC